MKILFTVFLLLAYGISSGQIRSNVTILKDTTVRVPSREYPHYADTKSLAIILSDGVILTDTSSITIGKGSLPNGDFKFIARYSTIDAQVYEVRLRGTTKSKMMEVQNITKKVTGNLTQYTIVCVGGYQVQLEEAVSAGEIIL